jgi:hypothetical protein
MSTHLNILALEPFYGGARRQMLQALQRLSRHEWTVLKLPARRIERRLAASSRWFAELIHRGDVESFDLLFTSEMLNLPDLQRIVPKLGRKPSIVFFHENQTPADGQESAGALDTVNLTSAMAASEIWFNSQYHLDAFIAKAQAMVRRNPETSGKDPASGLRHKAQVLAPPVELSRMYEILADHPRPPRDPRTLLFDLRGGGFDPSLIVKIADRLELRGEPFSLITIGSHRGLPDSLTRIAIPDRDEINQYLALHQAGVYVSLRQGATTDELFVPAMSTGCWPVVPEDAFYAELLPPMLHLNCMHDGNAEAIVNRILDAWYGERPMGYEYEQQELLSQFDAVRAVRVFDELLEEVVSGRAISM